MSYAPAITPAAPPVLASASYVPQQEHANRTASSSGTPLPQSTLLGSPKDDSDVDMSESEESAPERLEEEEVGEEAGYATSESEDDDDEPVVPAGRHGSKAKHGRRVELPDYLDADLYGLRRSVSCRVAFSRTR
jgi:general stress protein YciG